MTMLLCKISTIPTKFYFSLRRSNLNLIGIIKNAHHKYHVGMQHIFLPKHCSYSPIENTHIAGSEIYKIQAAGITTNIKLCGKHFVEHENKFAHEIMEMHPLYLGTILSKNSGSILQNNNIDLEEYNRLITKDWSCESASNICQAFNSISKFGSNTNVSITDEVFNGLCNSMAEKTNAFKDSELAEILSALALWPKTDSLNSHNFVSVWSALDKECVARVKQWNIESLLYFADHWYSLNLARVSNFMDQCIRKIGRKPSRLTPPQLVQSMFYVNVSRKLNNSISMYEYEYTIESCVEELSLNELAILAMGFFKSQTKIRSSNLLARMMQRTIDEIDTVNEISLCALLKVFRYSLPLALADNLFNLLNKLVPNIPRLSLLCCVHIILAGTNMQLFHEELFKIVSQRFASNISSLRIKDIERVAFALSLYDYDPQTKPCIYEQIVNELHNPERDEEIRKYPKCLAACLHYLTLRNVYCNELISKVLDPQFITDSYGKYHKKIDREILCLDISTVIECPNYNGNHLSSKLRRTLGKQYIHWSPTENTKKLNITEKLMLEVIDTLDSILGGPQYIYTGNILPHIQRADIVFGLTDVQSAVEVPTEFRTIHVGDIKYPPLVGSGIKWHCFVAGGANNFIRASEQPLGSTIAKIRQLKILGYSPLLIPWYEWIKIPTGQRQKYIQEKIGFES